VVETEAAEYPREKISGKKKVTPIREKVRSCGGPRIGMANGRERDRRWSEPDDEAGAEKARRRLNCGALS